MQAKLQALKPLTVAIGLALATLLSPGHAAPAVATWSLTEIPTLGGTTSFAAALNNSGQVTGQAALPNGTLHAFRFSQGQMQDLQAAFPSVSGIGNAINAAGAVAGTSSSLDGSLSRGFIAYADGALVNLGTLGGNSSWAYGINDSGDVVGAAQTGAGALRQAFLYRGGTLQALGTLSGDDESFAYGVNASGLVVGQSTPPVGASRGFSYGVGGLTDLSVAAGATGSGLRIGGVYAVNDNGDMTGSGTPATGTRPLLYRNGVLTDIALPVGATGDGLALNRAGLVVGRAQEPGVGAWAFLHSNGRTTDMNSLIGVAGSGWTLFGATGINDNGQIVGYGTNAQGAARGFLLTLNTTVWQGAPNASWDDPTNWSHGIAPNRNTQVFLEPLGSRTIVGPSTAVQAQTLTVGGNPADGSALATLRLNGGRIALTTAASVGLTVTANGVLTGQGSIAAQGAGAYEFYNHGRIVADDVSLEGMYLYNYGTIEGNGRLVAQTGIYHYAGSVRVARPGERLRIEGLLSNYASIEATRGEIDLTGPLFHYAGQIRLAEGTLRTGSLQNYARVDISSGINEVYGVVDNYSGGRITVSGQGQVTFWDAVQNYGELRVSSGAVATFFGDFYARNGGVLSGTGSKYYEAGYFVGDSPGVARDEGSVTFGRDAIVEMELGGLAAGSGSGFHDQLVVAGELSFDGTLVLVSWDGFTGQAGQTFDLFDWGSVSGQFDAIDSSGLLLAAGTRLDTSRLYLDGSIAITAVPEPGSALLMLLGLAGAGAGVSMKRRRRA